MESKKRIKYCYADRTNHTHIVEFAKNTVHQKSVLSSFQNVHNQVCDQNCEGSARGRKCVLAVHAYKCYQTHTPVYDQRQRFICPPLKEALDLLYHHSSKATPPTFTPFFIWKTSNSIGKLKDRHNEYL